MLCCRRFSIRPNFASAAAALRCLDDVPSTVGGLEPTGLEAGRV